MRLPIVKIGCARGIRLPQWVLKQCGINGYVSMEMDGDSLVIRASQSEVIPRDNLVHVRFGNL